MGVMKRIWLPGNSLGSIIPTVLYNSEILWSGDNWFPLNVVPVRLLQELDNRPLKTTPRPQQISKEPIAHMFRFRRPFAGAEFEQNMREGKNPTNNNL